MRLKLNLLPINSTHLNVNYNYSLSAAIYNLLRFSSKDFSEYLHDVGFSIDGKSYKLFSFALKFNSYIKINKNKIILDNKPIQIFISSPLADDFIKNFVLGSLNSQRIELVTEDVKTIFDIQTIESLPEPKFNNVNKFRLLSPLVLSTGIKENNKLKQKFLRTDHDKDELNKIFNSNLFNKYKLVTGKDYTGEPLLLEWDKDYIKKRLSENKRITKKVSVIKNKANPIDIIGNVVPFTLTGNKELVKIGYYCGFGEKNSLGFGLAELE
jgi:CRISPR-associated endoribonuclease Cas6